MLIFTHDLKQITSVELSFRPRVGTMDSVNGGTGLIFISIIAVTVDSRPAPEASYKLWTTVLILIPEEPALQVFYTLCQ